MILRDKWLSGWVTLSPWGSSWPREDGGRDTAQQLQGSGPLSLTRKTRPTVKIYAST
jgi:hypothetical protein